MTKDQFIKSDNLVTVRIVGGGETPFDRLVNTLPATDGRSFQALEEDLSGVAVGMTVKLPEGKRATVKKVSLSGSKAEVASVDLQTVTGEVSEPQSTEVPQ